MGWDFTTSAPSASERAEEPQTGYLQRWPSYYDLPDTRPTSSAQTWSLFGYGNNRLFGPFLPARSPPSDRTLSAPTRSVSPWPPRGDLVSSGNLASVTESAWAPIGTTLGMTGFGPRSAGATPSSTPPKTYSAVVQKNVRPCKAKKKNSRNLQRRYTATIPYCCATPKIKFYCESCHDEAPVQIAEQEELKPRVMPVATSQLGLCRFCQTNGEDKARYTSHNLRTDDGKVSCPVLREYCCPICKNKGGDYAHTVKYCPLNGKRSNA